MVDEHNFVHDVMTLALVSQNFALENGINVRIEEIHGQRFADARIVIGPQSAIGIEVKTHHLLRHWKGGVLTSDEADKVIRHCFGSADTKEGQLKDNQPGLLVIGNLSLSPENKQVLLDAAWRKLVKSAESRRHIYGVGLIWFEQKIDHDLRPYPVLDSLGFHYNRPTIHTGRISFNHIQNPHYTGTVHMRVTPGTHSPLVLP